MNTWCLPYSTALQWYDPLWYSQVVNIRIHYSKKLKELSDKLAESKNEQSKLKLAADNAAQLKRIPPTRTIKVRGPFRIYIGSSRIWSALTLLWISGKGSGIKNTDLEWWSLRMNWRNAIPQLLGR